MPVAIPLIGLAVSAGMGGLQMAKANKDKKNAKKAIDDYQRQDLINPASGLQVSTLGADRQREDLARTLASYGNMVSMGGSRSIAASLPNLLEQQNNQEAQIAANLDQEQSRIDQIKANAQLGVMNMQEQRENADLVGLGTQLDLANAQSTSAKNSLMSGVANGLMNVASAGAAAGWFGKGAIPTAGATGNINLGSLMGTNKLTNPVQLSTGEGYTFGNNINGFAYGNQNIPGLSYLKLR